MKKKPEVCVRGHCVFVEIAQKPRELKRGLQFRNHLDKDAGMLFVFEEPGEYRFWMKDTLIPLDMIWISDRGEIVHIEENVQPCLKNPCSSYGGKDKACYVLEVNAGFSALKGLAVGDRVQFHL